MHDRACQVVEFGNQVKDPIVLHRNARDAFSLGERKGAESAIGVSFHSRVRDFLEVVAAET
jgi:hypothetical protein